jgi:hypothetical protein
MFHCSEKYFDSEHMFIENFISSMFFSSIFHLYVYNETRNCLILDDIKMSVNIRKIVNEWGLINQLLEIQVNYERQTETFPVV